MKEAPTCRSVSLANPEATFEKFDEAFGITANINRRALDRLHSTGAPKAVTDQYWMAGNLRERGLSKERYPKALLRVLKEELEQLIPRLTDKERASVVSDPGKFGVDLWSWIIHKHRQALIYRGYPDGEGVPISAITEAVVEVLSNYGGNSPDVGPCWSTPEETVVALRRLTEERRREVLLAACDPEDFNTVVRERPPLARDFFSLSGKFFDYSARRAIFQWYHPKIDRGTLADEVRRGEAGPVVWESAIVLNSLFWQKVQDVLNGKPPRRAADVDMCASLQAFLEHQDPGPLRLARAFLAEGSRHNRRCEGDWHLYGDW